jgi:hypothetical protein
MVLLPGSLRLKGPIGVLRSCKATVGSSALSAESSFMLFDLFQYLSLTLDAHRRK